MSFEALSCHPMEDGKASHVPMSRKRVIEIMQGLLATETEVCDQKLLALAKLEQEVQEARQRVSSLMRAYKAVVNAMEVDGADRREEIVRQLEEVPGPQRRNVMKAIVRGLRHAEIGIVSNLSQATDVILVNLCYYVRDVWSDVEMEKVEEVLQLVLMNPSPDTMYRDLGNSDDFPPEVNNSAPEKWQGLLYSTRRLPRKLEPEVGMRP